MPPTESDIIKAIESIRTETATTINCGLRDIHESVKALERGHNLALLEQERRNSTFADRERVEAIALHVHENGSIAQQALLRMTLYDKTLEALNSRLDGIGDRLDDAVKALNGQSMSLLSGLNGYLVSLVLMVLTGLVGFFIHFLH